MSSWTVDPVFPVWIIAVGLIPSFAFFLWKESKSNQRFLVIRLIAQIIILISLLGILTRPSLKKETKTSGLLLLTNNYDKSTADSLINKYSDLKVVRTADATLFTNSEIVEPIDIPAFGSEIKFIIGEGISSDVLDLMPEKNFKFIPGKNKSGVVQLVIQKPVRVNQKNKINGIFHLTNSKVLVKLVGPSGVEDSISLKGRGPIPFSFSIKPKQAGLFLYSIESNDYSKSKETLPIEILPERKLNILFLQKFPTAETRCLKNFLIEKGHAIALRYQTSKTKFNYEYANTPSEGIDYITSAIAKAKDLVFLDSQVLTELSSNEKIILSNAVKDGLGMIILDLPEKEKRFNQFLSIKIKITGSDTAHISFENSKTYVLPVQTIEIMSDQSLQPELVHKKRIISGYKYSGAGKVGFQLLRETYRVRLEGNMDDYSSIWSSLIDRTARTKNKQFDAGITTPFPYYQDQSLEVRILSSGTKPTLYDGDIQLPISEDVVIDDLWKGRTWAGKSGWHKLLIKEDSTELDYYVSNKNDWKSLRFMNYSNVTRLAQSKTDTTSLEAIKIDDTPISLFVFFLMFLIASGFLWLVPKI